ncbi:DNA (cytosine-5-)-methyltransferase [Maribacter dokdonensis]|uniref:DNA (cytosine-5-)-methyltransferase n=1 Tax=Maribacter dokdonensis TaxID=320912 RepID=UPI0007199B68|nr:DNA (cytosine-5-)-methyltransferase [Maribacter dokdonensis]KSA13839.1 DNA-cytosine methyltransferase [Maribacter dokdonensis DSW-8]
MPIRVVELFAGVGGFRIGLEGYPKKNDANYDVVWSNQWEPSTKAQHANMVYENRWPNANHCGENIEEVIENKFDEIPDHDLLVGGFPCQDYSVATTLKNSKGLIGKKGVLWWSIEAILRRKAENSPRYLMLENVDRLLKSPSKQRGRDFAVMLASLNNLGYAVEWRVINAAEYGMPQRRRRVFFLAYRNDTNIYNRILETQDKEDWLDSDGVIASAFPVREINEKINRGNIEGDLINISEEFNKGEKNSPFENCGVMINGEFTTVKVKPDYHGLKQTLGSKLIDIEEVPNEFFISQEDINKQKGWKYLKGSKSEVRQTKEGFKYNYSEGSMIFPDALDNASRTIITGEGGKSPSRFKHVVEQNGRLRRLTPKELERLNMFPDNHTELDGISDTKRAFFMGNALVVGIVKKLGEELSERVDADINEEQFA